VYVALTTAGITLAKSVIDLITAIVKARSDGIKKGDSATHPVELIVRRVHRARESREDILRVGRRDSVSEVEIERKLKDALRKLLKMVPRNQLSGSGNSRFFDFAGPPQPRSGERAQPTAQAVVSVSTHKP
jgi:hypothetical protein